MKIKGVVVELMVKDVDKTIEFYQKVLGFTLIASETENDSTYWALMHMGHFKLSFKEEKRLKREVPYFDKLPVGGSSAICLKVDQLENYYALVSSKCELINHPHITPCGSRQFSMLDNNGYILTIEKFA